MPILFNLRTDPYENATITSNTYWDWYIDRAYLLIPAQSLVIDHFKTYVEYPPRMKSASFTIDQDAIIEMLTPPSS
jgi:arylsulfatase